MALSPKKYDKMSKSAAPPTKSYRNIPMAFLFGGIICTIGQAFTNLYGTLGFDEESAPIAASVTLIFLSVLLTGLRIYPKLAKIAGAGTLVPITGFANAMSSPAIEFKSEGLVMGLGAKMFVIVGPVIVYGMAAGILYGIIIFAFGLY